jgi:hypothetical protein
MILDKLREKRNQKSNAAHTKNILLQEMNQGTVSNAIGAQRKARAQDRGQSILQAQAQEQASPLPGTAKKAIHSKKNDPQLDSRFPSGELSDDSLPFGQKVPSARHFFAEQDEIRKALIADEEDTLFTTQTNATDGLLAHQIESKVQTALQRLRGPQHAQVQHIYSQMFPEGSFLDRVARDIGKDIALNGERLTDLILSDLLEEVAIELTEQEDKFLREEEEELNKYEDLETALYQLNLLTGKTHKTNSVSVGFDVTKGNGNKATVGKKTVERALSYRKEREYYQQRFLGGRNLISTDTAKTADVHLFLLYFIISVYYRVAS